MNIHPWNQGLAKKLADALNSLPHAVLLAGPPGLGKADFAQWLAGLLLCAQPTSDHQALQNRAAPSATRNCAPRQAQSLKPSCQSANRLPHD